MKAALLLFSVFLTTAGMVPATSLAAPTHRIVLTGDILLSREVQREIESKHGQSPWEVVKPFLASADWVLGNFEGAVGAKSACLGGEASLCFAVPQSLLPLLKQAHFKALGVENNHSGDLGTQGRQATREALLAQGLAPLDFDESPGFLRLGNQTIAFIGLSLVPAKDGKQVQIPSYPLRQKLKFARALADWIFVYVHWGAELQDWPSPHQRKQAKWLIDNGVDVIVGHHPHVVQAPECIEGHPVFFSLGNHVFDQKYPMTKQGLIAECTISGDALACSGIQTQTAPGTSFPEIVAKGNSTSAPQLSHCKVTPTRPLTVHGYQFRPMLADHQFVTGEIVLEGHKPDQPIITLPRKRLLSVMAARFKTDETHPLLLTLEMHPSSIDQEIGPRPYVYEVAPQGLIARWRGSALAWPLLDVTLLSRSSGPDSLCALHRKDSFLILNSKSKEVRTSVYRWNGFGFSGLEDSSLASDCSKTFEMKPIQ